jgi:hypothetical protein
MPLGVGNRGRAHLRRPGVHQWATPPLSRGADGGSGRAGSTSPASPRKRRKGHNRGERDHPHEHAQREMRHDQEKENRS